MKTLLLLVVAALSAFGQTAPTPAPVPTPSLGVFVAGGAAFDNTASPKASGWAVGLQQLSPGGKTYLGSRIDFTNGQTTPTAAIWQQVWSAGVCIAAIEGDVGFTFTAANVGAAFSSGIAAVCRLPETLFRGSYLVGSVHGSKTTVGITGYYPVYRLGIGWYF